MGFASSFENVGGLCRSGCVTQSQLAGLVSPSLSSKPNASQQHFDLLTLASRYLRICLPLYPLTYHEDWVSWHTFAAILMSDM